MIELQRITKSYTTGSQSLQVLKGVDMRVSAERLVAIMGSSGSSNRPSSTSSAARCV